MATKRDLYNLAFAHLGEATVATLTDDPVPPAVAKANALFDAKFEAALTRAPWLCALESLTLPLDAPPPGGWNDWKHPHRFTCPLGTLKVWSVDGVEEGESWQRGSRVTGAGALVVIKAESAAARRVELQMRRPPEALTPLLVIAFALDFASVLAGAIQQNENKAASLKKQADDAYLLAEASELGEVGEAREMLGLGGLARARASAL